MSVPTSPAPDEEPLDTPSMWIEFVDPDEPEQTYRCDLTWFTSAYHCIFGAGCPGIYAGRPDDGCCTLGAHFTDQDDVDRVEAIVDRLDESTWQFHAVAAGRRGATSPPGTGWTHLEDGTRVTDLLDGACILLNRPGFAAGAGCALHSFALVTGIDPHAAKPDVCWQLPIRRSYREVTRPDETTYLEITLAEYDRRGWGPGGHDLDWYCTRDPRAHDAAAPLFRGAEAELRALMGDAAYAVLAQACAAHLLAVAALRRTPAGRALLPLYVHPATLAARAAK